MVREEESVLSYFTCKFIIVWQLSPVHLVIIGFRQNSFPSKLSQREIFPHGTKLPGSIMLRFCLYVVLSLRALQRYHHVQTLYSNVPKKTHTHTHTHAHTHTKCIIESRFRVQGLGFEQYSLLLAKYTRGESSSKSASPSYEDICVGPCLPRPLRILCFRFIIEYISSLRDFVWSLGNNY